MREAYGEQRQGGEAGHPDEAEAGDEECVGKGTDGDDRRDATQHRREQILTSPDMFEDLLDGQQEGELTGEAEAERDGEAGGLALVADRFHAVQE